MCSHKDIPEVQRKLKWERDIIPSFYTKHGGKPKFVEPGDK